jgi:hypothetical protein
MSKPRQSILEYHAAPFFLRIGQASRLFGISRTLLRRFVAAGKIRPRRFTPRGHWRFVTAELSQFFGLHECVPKVLVPLNDQLGCDLRSVVRDAVEQGRKVAQGELKAEMERLREEMRELARAANRKEPVSGKSVQRVLDEWRAEGGSTGGAY